MVTVGGGRLTEGGGAATGIWIRPSLGSIGAAAGAMMQADKDGGGSSKEEAVADPAAKAKTSRDARLNTSLGKDGVLLRHPELDLTGTDLSNRNLSGAEIPGTKFDGARLAGVDFGMCNLASCSFRRADLTGAMLN